MPTGKQATAAQAEREAEWRKLGEPTFTVAGKRVTMRARLPLRDGHRLPELLKAYGNDDLATLIPLLCVVIESWDFDGSPQDEDAYGDLDVYTEFPTLTAEVVKRVARRLADTDPKASATPSAARSSSR